MTQLAPTLTVVVPTYNERDNVRALHQQVCEALEGVSFEMIYVDDNSPDGTAAEVHALSQQDGRVHLISRIDRRGLAGACIEGILAASSELAVVMDGDLQHDAHALPKMLAKFENHPALDLVIGSRFLDGNDASSGLSSGVRELGTAFAIWTAKRLMRIRSTDPMTGFFMVKRATLARYADQLQHEGFKILADLLSCGRKNLVIDEVGFKFNTRHAGESKMDTAVALEFLALVVSRIFMGLLPLRFVLFAAVGVSGILVQLLFTGLSRELMGFLYAQSIGVFAAMTSNYTLNNLITYRDLSLSGIDWFRGLFSFYLVCALGALANVAVARLMLEVTELWWLASICGAIMGAIWNYTLSARATWRA